jgi:hypothetical protein
MEAGGIELDGVEIVRENASIYQRWYNYFITLIHLNREERKLEDVLKNCLDLRWY